MIEWDGYIPITPGAFLRRKLELVNLAPDEIILFYSRKLSNFDFRLHDLRRCRFIKCDFNRCKFDTLVLVEFLTCNFRETEFLPSESRSNGVSPNENLSLKNGISFDKVLFYDCTFDKLDIGGRLLGDFTFALCTIGHFKSGYGVHVGKVRIQNSGDSALFRDLLKLRPLPSYLSEFSIEGASNRRIGWDLIRFIQHAAVLRISAIALVALWLQAVLLNKLLSIDILNAKQLCIFPRQIFSMGCVENLIVAYSSKLSVSAVMISLLIFGSLVQQSFAPAVVREYSQEDWRRSGGSYLQYRWAANQAPWAFVISLIAYSIVAGYFLLDLIKLASSAISF